MTHQLTVATICLLLLAGGGFAQESSTDQSSEKPAASAPQPPAEPAPSDGANPSTEDEKILQDLLRRKRQEKPIEPRRPAAPAAPGAEGGQAASTARGTAPAAIRHPSPRLGEGTFIVARRGRLLKVEGGPTPWAFTFTGDSTALEDPPLYLMPGQELQAMEDAIQEHGADAQFILSGEVFTYRGQSFLLPRLARVAADRGNLQP